MSPSESSDDDGTPIVAIDSHQLTLDLDSSNGNLLHQQSVGAADLLHFLAKYQIPLDLLMPVGRIHPNGEGLGRARASWTNRSNPNGEGLGRGLGRARIDFSLDCR